MLCHALKLESKRCSRLSSALDLICAEGEAIEIFTLAQDKSLTTTMSSYVPFKSHA